MSDAAPTLDTSHADEAIDADDQQRILRTLWEPHVGQRAILEAPVRFKIVACGRRWGKSEMAAHAALGRALEQPEATVWWVAPSYSQANEFGFDKMTPLLSPDLLAESPTRTKPRKIRLTTGSEISFRSAEREDSLRGGGVDYLVIDEAGSVPERAWAEELRPSLSDTVGDLLAIGTPRGRNWFYRWFQRGQSGDHGDVASWQAPTYQNPHVPDAEIDAAEGDMPERAFEQEHLASFVDDNGGVFEQVRERAVEEYDLPVSADASAAPYAIGVDFARLENWTAIVVLDADARLVAFDRLKETTWHRIQRRVEHLADEYAPNQVAVDATRDNKIVQDLVDGGLAVEPVNFGSRKQVLIDNLATRLEAGELTLSADVPVLVNELEVFEYDVTESGTIRYSAPSGFHDDCVDALALAVEAAGQGGGEVIRRTGDGIDDIGWGSSGVQRGPPSKLSRRRHREQSRGGDR